MTIKLERTREQWEKCDPETMSKMSQPAIFFALRDAKHDMLAMHEALLSASKPATPEGWKLVLVNRSYDMRAKAIIAFNTTEQSGKDRDDALDAAWHAMLAASPAAPAQSESYVDIVFAEPHDQAASHEFTFVEVEDEQGRSIRFGKWIKRDDGYWVLRIAAQPASGAK